MTENQSNRFSYIDDNLAEIREKINNAKSKSGRTDEVHLMAVTKTVSFDAVNYAISKGVSLLGENRVQEFLSKADSYTAGTRVHFIGHLQTNKVKYIADKVDMIQSVDSMKLAEEINKACAKINKVMPVLVEVNCGEESKSGISFNEVENLLKEMSKLPNISVEGLMTIPPGEQSEYFFAKMQEKYIDIKAKKLDNIDMTFLSMGMSGDYEKAIEYGANIVRIGTKLFGARK